MKIEAETVSQDDEKIVVRYTFQYGPIALINGRLVEYVFPEDRARAAGVEVREVDGE